LAVSVESQLKQNVKKCSDLNPLGIYFYIFDSFTHDDKIFIRVCLSVVGFYYNNGNFIK